MHGTLNAKMDSNAPTCKECHGTHGTLGRLDPKSPTFATNIPTLCCNCHREGEKAAMRYEGSEKNIVNNYTESIHGKGLLKSGLTVTATFVIRLTKNCHTLILNQVLTGIIFPVLAEPVIMEFKSNLKTAFILL
jgi:hypothetical protein